MIMGEESGGGKKWQWLYAVIATMQLGILGAAVPWAMEMQDTASTMKVEIKAIREIVKDDRSHLRQAIEEGNGKFAEIRAWVDKRFENVPPPEVKIQLEWLKKEVDLLKERVEELRK